MTALGTCSGEVEVPYRTGGVAGEVEHIETDVTLSTDGGCITY